MTMTIEQIFVCVDGEVIIAAEESVDCPVCGNRITPTGHIETKENNDREQDSNN